MLPTKGYFQDIECPYNDISCGRPYCHFRHKKKQQESTGENSPKELDIPTYKPTPKSELANNKSHIPISYVPDLAFRPERSHRQLSKISFDKPTYKPTPLSILSSVTKQSGILNVESKENKDSQDHINEIKQNIANVEYTPTQDAENAISAEYTPTNNENLINDGHRKSGQYEPKGDNVSELKYKPTKAENICKKNREKDEYKPSGDNATDIQYNPTNKDEIVHEGYDPTHHNSAINFEDLSNEFDLIDAIISDTDITNKSAICDDNNDNLSKNNDSKSKHDRSHSSSKSSSDSKNTSEKRRGSSSKSDKKTNKNDNKKSSSTKKEERRTSTSKSEEKNSKTETEKQKHGSKSEKNAKDDCQEEKIQKTEKHKSHDKNKEKSHKDKNKEKTKHKEHSTNRESNKREKTKTSEKDKEKHHHEIRASEKEKSKHSSKDKEKDRRESENDRNKHRSRSKERDKDKKKKHSSNSNNSSSSKTKTYKKDKEPAKNELEYSKDLKGSKRKALKKIESPEKSNSSDEESYSKILDEFNVDDIDLGMECEDETLLECYKIFNEYKPEDPLITQSKQMTSLERVSELTDEESIFGKKRIAHINSDNVTPKITHAKVKQMPSAEQIMANRFKLARQAQANDEQRNIMNEIKQHAPVKRPAPPSLAAAAKSYKIQKTLAQAQLNKPASKPTSVVDQILNGTVKTNTALAKFAQRKIAPVSNVYSFQQAKERINEITKKRAEGTAINRTPAQIQKSGQRIAHVPDISLSDIPDVLQADKSKLPVNVRSRFLTMLADECVKLYMSKEDAYTRALNEEFCCYEKCKVIATYRNSAMLAVSRVRKEFQEREKLGLGPMESGDSSHKDKTSEFKGEKFYKNVSKYILTDEELDIHKYPKESFTVGKAVIKNRKPSLIDHLDDNQRKCVRCSKIYVVDDEGFAFYDEECLYHPLKKRTLRGEATYLCCKSNDETGCVTSHTHVSDFMDDSELEGYQSTMEPDHDDDPRSYTVYALDCEMCYTTKGLELTRVTIIDNDCKTVYESLVKPLNPIIDYNTRFSGITKEQMERTSTSILQVQANILHLCNSKTILIGHSLESDMKALKIIHGTVVDTSVLFPHRLGLPHKRALRALASEYLKKIIQNDISGHDSAEDAVTCMELIKYKIKEELKVRGLKV